MAEASEVSVSAVAAITVDADGDCARKKNDLGFLTDLKLESYEQVFRGKFAVKCSTLAILFLGFTS